MSETPAHGDFAHRLVDRPVRPYVITRGRSRPSRNTIRPETLLAAAASTSTLSPESTSEQHALLDLCQGVLSVVEAAAHLGLPVSVVAVVASDLVDAGLLTVWSAAPAAGLPEAHILERVLDGLRNL